MICGPGHYARAPSGRRGSARLHGPSVGISGSEVRLVRASDTGREEATVVIFMNKFKVRSTPGEFERVFEENTALLRRQPGFIRFRLVRSSRHPDVCFNIAEWENADAHQRVVQSEEFQAHIRDLSAVAESDIDMYSVVLEGHPESQPQRDGDAGTQTVALEEGRAGR